MKNVEEGLTFLGLSKKEIKIFIAFLTRNSLTESGLSRMIKIPRTTIAPILRKLEKRGLIERISIKNHKEWKVINLDIIQGNLNKAARLFE